MKASDIPDEAFIAAVRTCRQGPSGWASLWDVERQFPDVPPKVVLAKARRLLARGVLGGCPCGCRGDFHVVEDALDGPYSPLRPELYPQP